MQFVGRLCIFFPLLLVTIVFSGCEPPKFYECEGLITHDGKPMPGLQVMFAPVIIDSVRTPIGLTDSEGYFRMTTGRHVGIPPGKYTVQVVDPVEADGRRTSTDPEYLYVIDRYSPTKSDYIYEADRDRVNFELKLDTKEYTPPESTDAGESTEAGKPSEPSEPSEAGESSEAAEAKPGEE